MLLSKKKFSWQINKRTGALVAETVFTEGMIMQSLSKQVVFPVLLSLASLWVSLAEMWSIYYKLMVFKRLYEGKKNYHMGDLCKMKWIFGIYSR